MDIDGLYLLGCSSSNDSHTQSLRPDAASTNTHDDDDDTDEPPSNQESLTLASTRRLQRRIPTHSLLSPSSSSYFCSRINHSLGPTTMETLQANFVLLIFLEHNKHYLYGIWRVTMKTKNNVMMTPIQCDNPFRQ